MGDGAGAVGEWRIRNVLNRSYLDTVAILKTLFLRVAAGCRFSEIYNEIRTIHGPSVLWVLDIPS